MTEWRWDWLWAFALNGAVFSGGYLWSRYAFRQPRGWPRMLATALLGWIAIELGMQVLGSCGWLRPLPLLLWSSAFAAVGWGFHRKAKGDPTAANFATEPKTLCEPLSWDAVIVVGLTLVAAMTMGMTSLLGPVKVMSDGPIYHLPFAVQWWRAGELFLVPAPFGESAATYFPASGELWFCWLLCGWGDDALAKIGQAPFWIVSTAACYALARRCGANRSASAIGACWFATSAPLLIFTFEPNVDSLFIAGYLVSCYFLAHYLLGDDDWPSLVLAGLAAGWGWSCKATGLAFTPPLLLLGAIAVVSARGGGSDGERSWPRRLRDVALFWGSALIPLAYWFGRNAWLTGNPLYPTHLKIGGWTLLSGWYDREAMQRSHFYIPVERWEALVDTLLAVIDPRLALFWLPALLWALVRKPDLKNPAARAAAIACAALALLNIAIYWLAIPYRTQQRFMIQALGLAAIPLSLTLDSARWLRVGAAILLAIHLLTPQPWPFGPSNDRIPWDLAPEIPNATPALIQPLSRAPSLAMISREKPTPPSWPALGVTIALAIGLIHSLNRIQAPTRRRWLRSSAWGSALALWVGYFLHPGGESPRLRFYPIFPDYAAGWLALDHRTATASETPQIAYSGTNIPYYLFGPGLRRDVRYINIDEHRDWRMHQYRAQAIRQGQSPTWPDPRPGWDRAEANYEAWIANLRAEKIKYLVVTRANPDEGRHNPHDAQGFPIEREWAESHPEAFAPIYGVLENEREMRIYALK